VWACLTTAAGRLTGPLPTSTLSDMGLGLNIPAAQRNISVDEAFAVIHRML